MGGAQFALQHEGQSRDLEVGREANKRRSGRQFWAEYNIPTLFASHCTLHIATLLCSSLPPPQHAHSRWSRCDVVGLKLLTALDQTKPDQTRPDQTDSSDRAGDRLVSCLNLGRLCKCNSLFLRQSQSVGVCTNVSPY